MDPWNRLLNAPSWGHVPGWVIAFAAHWDDEVIDGWPGISHVLAYNFAEPEQAVYPGVSTVGLHTALDDPPVWHLSEAPSGKRTRLVPDPVATTDWLIDRLGEHIREYGAPRNWWTSPLGALPTQLEDAFSPLSLLIEPGSDPAGTARQIHAQALSPNASGNLLDKVAAPACGASVRTLIKVSGHRNAGIGTVELLAQHPNPMVRRAASNRLLSAVSM